MRLQIVRTLWGVVEDPTSMEAADVPFDAIAAAGYDAVGVAAAAVDDLDGFVSRATRAGLAFVPQLFTWGASVDDHVESFQRSLEQIAPHAPSFVIAQAGRDSFNGVESVAFFEACLAIEADLGVPVAFETHRGRTLFNPWRTLELLERFDALHLGCDLSHWVCVAERLKLGRDVIAACAERALHIDARVGHEEGPQVSDPRAPEFEVHLATHLAWWEEIWDGQERRGLEVASVMPEFGPPPYQSVLPYGGGVVGDRDEINDWMATLIRERFSARSL
jgi:sugar phosphate isomerase/epimerase